MRRKAYRLKSVLLLVGLMVLSSQAGMGLGSEEARIELLPSPRTYLSHVSTDSQGQEGNDESWWSSTSGTGRYVAFHSMAGNFAPGDTNGDFDIFRKDMVTGQVIVASADSAGDVGNDWSQIPSISFDGRYVAFESQASNLVPDDTNFDRDVFRKDLQTGEILRVSEDSSGAQASGNSGWSAISSNGMYVSFSSDASDLVPGDLNSTLDIFRKDLSTGEVLRVSEDAFGGEANGESASSSISSNGRYVAFESDASNLVPDDVSRHDDVFIKDLQSGKIRRVSTRSSGGEADGHSYHPSISATGRYVAWISEASNLVPGDNNETADIFRKDLLSGAIVRVSVGSESEEADESSGWPSISDTGRYVAFHSFASNLVPGTPRGSKNVYRKDLLTGEVLKVSIDACESSVYGGDEPSISSDGRYVAFESWSSLAPRDTGSDLDVFFADLVLHQNMADICVNVLALGSTTVPRGGTLTYEVFIFNNTASSRTFSAKTSVSGPATIDPLDGPVSVSLRSEGGVSQPLEKTVPNAAPLGNYLFCAQAFEDTRTLDEDCIEFEIVP